MRRRREVVLADKVDLLFRKRTQPNGREWPTRALEETTGITGATFWKVRHGQNPNPGLKVIQALCTFFEVPLGYFDCQSLEECEAFLDRQRVREAGELVSAIALRAADLSPEAQASIAKMIEFARAAEGLDSKT